MCLLSNTRIQGQFNTIDPQSTNRTTNVFSSSTSVFQIFQQLLSNFNMLLSDV